MWEDGDDFIYGFPAINGPRGGIKVASESVNPVDPDNVDRNVSSGEIDEVYKKVSRLLPDITPNCIRSEVCLYTNTPDRNFVIDFHPECQNIIIASPCSGHGFKHIMAIGETLAELAIDSRTSLDIEYFRLNRFDK